MDQVASESITQLAENKPQFDTPLRVAIPVNAPTRKSRDGIDRLSYLNAFSPAALQANRKRISNSTDSSSGFGGIVSPVATNIVNMDHDAQVKTAIKDYGVLAFSSKRSGKSDLEAVAYVSSAIIHDNQGNFSKAIDNYLLYLELCEKMNDLVGAACACNCLGVNYMLLVSPQSDAGTLLGVHTLNSKSVDYLNLAIEYHSKHLAIGPDDGGRFVANINIGLCLGMVGNIASSAKYQQDALRIAIKMQTLYGQSIAVGNLGNLALLKRDFVTAKTCFEQHLQLVQALSDNEAEIKAWKMIADVKYAEADYSASIESLEQAKKIAIKEGSLNELKKIHCHIGISTGNLDFEEYTNLLKKSL